LSCIFLRLHHSNSFLTKMGATMPNAKKTGTTIAGVIYKDGVVLGADTRATSGSIVCDKNCEKIHHISSRIWCCGAGTSADTENTTNLIASQLELLRLTTGQEPRVVTAMTRLKQYLFKHQGHVSAALVLGGIDATGSYLYTVHPHGSVDQLPFATMGSGSLAAMAIFEAGYRDDLSEEEAVELVADAIQSGIMNDLGSGSNVDICVISKVTKDARVMRSYRQPVPHIPRTHTGYEFPRGTTQILAEARRMFKEDIQVVPVAAPAGAGSAMHD
jgi:20S proteasome subunit beta 2